MRVMALDVGEKRIGVAISDELGLTAQPVCTLERVGRRRDLAALARLQNEHQAGLVVVGMPYRLDGRPGPQAEKIAAFTRRLARQLPVPVTTWDERLSTTAAERVLIQGDVSRRRRRQVVDQLAAVIILQNYLDRHGAALPPAETNYPADK